MKIGLLSSYRGQKKFEKEHKSILEYFQKSGHEVIHTLNIRIEDILTLGWIEREEMFMKFYKKLESCDVVFAESTVQSTQVGFGLSYIRSKGIPVVILTIRDVDEYSPKKNAYSNIENIMFCQYDISDINKILGEALSYMELQLDKRFTIIFPAHFLARIETAAHKKKVSKAVYIRQLIEKDLQDASVE